MGDMATLLPTREHAAKCTAMLRHEQPGSLGPTIEAILAVAEWAVGVEAATNDALRAWLDERVGKPWGDRDRLAAQIECERAVAVKAWEEAELVVANNR